MTTRNTIAARLRTFASRYWGVILIIVIWQAWVTLRGLNVIVMPSPWRVVTDIVSNPGVYLANSAQTLSLAVIGLVLGMLVGSGIAVLAWTSRVLSGILVPLGLTSNDAAMRALRGGWKRLQRLAYPAAILTLVHWALVHDGLVAAVLHFVPLALLQAVRVARLFSSPSSRSLA